MPPSRRKLAAAEPAQRTLPDLRSSVDSTLAAMDWLTDTDQALADVARALADQIETAQQRADMLADARVTAGMAGDLAAMKRLQQLEAMCDVTKVVGWLGPQLQGVLRDLGGTPTARRAMRPDQPMGGRLAALRAGAATRTTPGSGRKRSAAPVDATAGKP